VYLTSLVLNDLAEWKIMFWGRKKESSNLAAIVSCFVIDKRGYTGVGEREREIEI